MKEQRLFETAIDRLRDLRSKKETNIAGDPFAEFQILSEAIDQLERFYNVNTIEVSSEDIRRLRNQTGISLADAESILKQYHGDYDKAVSAVRSRGFA